MALKVDYSLPFVKIFVCIDKFFTAFMSFEISVGQNYDDTLAIVHQSKIFFLFVITRSEIL